MKCVYVCCCCCHLCPLWCKIMCCCCALSFNRNSWNSFLIEQTQSGEPTNAAMSIESVHQTSKVSQILHPRERFSGLFLIWRLFCCNKRKSDDNAVNVFHFNFNFKSVFDSFCSNGNCSCCKFSTGTSLPSLHTASPTSSWGGFNWNSSTKSRRDTSLKISSR